MPILTPEERVETLLADRYRLERIIGEGGMGVVYEATHTWTNRKCAVKMLHPSYLREHPDLAQRFLSEARTATAVRHPNVVDVLDMGSSDGTVFLVLELLDGEPLSSLLKRRRLSIEEVLTILLPAMGAIAVAHDKGIIHRDLKPENIFCHHDAHDMVPKVLDFGLAKALRATDGARTVTGLVMGTPNYLAPEQAQGETTARPALDVWAMGVVLYQALSGRLPFFSEAQTAVILKICMEEPAPLASLVPEIPPALAAVVHHALEKKPADRYPDMRALGNAVIDAARGAGLVVIVPRGLGDPGSTSFEDRMAAIAVPPDSKSGVQRKQGSTPLPNEKRSAELKETRSGRVAPAKPAAQEELASDPTTVTASQELETRAMRAPGSKPIPIGGDTALLPADTEHIAEHPAIDTAVLPTPDAPSPSDTAEHPAATFERFDAVAEIDTRVSTPDISPTAAEELSEVPRKRVPFAAIAAGIIAFVVLGGIVIGVSIALLSDDDEPHMMVRPMDEAEETEAAAESREPAPSEQATDTAEPAPSEQATDTREPEALETVENEATAASSEEATSEPSGEGTRPRPRVRPRPRPLTPVRPRRNIATEW